VGLSSRSLERVKWDGWPVLAVALLAFAFVSFAPLLFNDGDTYWHLGAGRWISDHFFVPLTDPFSFTARGQAWTAHEWLSELMMASAYGLGSWAGLGVLFGGAVGLTLLLAGIELRKVVKPLQAAAALVLLFILLEPSLLARPHVLAWPVIAAWTILLLHARAHHEAPPLVAGLVMLVWANLHASFVFGLVMIPFFAFEALLYERDRAKALVGWGLFALVSVAVVLLNPAGLQGLLYAFQVSSMKILPLISEWRPSSLSKDPLFFGMTAIAAIAVVLKRPRIPFPRLLLIAALFYLAVSHARHQALFGIVSLLLVTPSLGERRSTEPVLPGSATAALLGGLLLVSIARLIVPVPHPDTPVYPAKAIASVPPSLRSQPVLNAYDFGGALILHGIAPFIDGRADMYGDEHTADAYAIERGDAQRFNAAVKRWNIRWTILHPSERLVSVLDRDPAWRRAYADDYAVIHVRK
jgi:hypothetical protein